MCHSHSHHTHAHTHALFLLLSQSPYIIFLSLSPTLSHSLSVTLSLTLSISHSISHTHTHTRSHALFTFSVFFSKSLASGPKQFKADAPIFNLSFMMHRSRSRCSICCHMTLAASGGGPVVSTAARWPRGPGFESCCQQLYFHVNLLSLSVRS